MAEITYRNATRTDIPAMSRFIFRHGPNRYNYLPREGVNAHLDGIGKRTAKTAAIIAMHGRQLVGFVSYMWGNVMPKYERKEHGYVAEAVVHQKRLGEGIGTEIGRRAVQALKRKGLAMVYVKHHTGNAPSRKTWKRLGF